MKTSPTMPCHWHLSTRSCSVCSSSRCCWIRNLRELGKGLKGPREEEEADYWNFSLLRMLNTEILWNIKASWWLTFSFWTFSAELLLIVIILVIILATCMESLVFLWSTVLISLWEPSNYCRSAATSGMYSFSVDFLFIWTQQTQFYRCTFFPFICLL